MRTNTARMGKSGRLVIPVELRRKLGVEAGDELILHLDEQGLHVSTPALALVRAQAFVKGLGLEGRNLAAELVAERRREAVKEDR